MSMFERLIKIKGKSFEDLTVEEVASMILADSSIFTDGNELFSPDALDEFLYYGVEYSPELEIIRKDILTDIYIDVKGKKEKLIDVEFLKRYSAGLIS